MADVVDLSGKPHAPINLPVQKVIEELPAPGEMDTLVCIGWRANGEFYFHSSEADGASTLWLMEVAKLQLLTTTTDRWHNPVKPGVA